MCDYTVKVHTCGHYEKFIKKACKKAKKTNKVCYPGKLEDSETTGLIWCGIKGCDKEPNNRREGPGSRKDGGFDEEKVDWEFV